MAPHPPHRPLAPEETEDEAFHQDKFEALGIQLKEKHGAITPVEQERLGVLQAKMNDLWAQKLGRAARFGHSFATSLAPSGEPVVQRVMDKTELNKLYTILDGYRGVLDHKTLDEIWDRFRLGFDTVEAAGPDLKSALEFAGRQAEERKFRVNAEKYPRVYLAADDKPSREYLNEKMGKKQKGKGFDLGYREHVDLIDEELDQFLPERDYPVGDPRRAEQRDLYNEAVRGSQVSISPRKREGMFSVEAQGGLPLTTMTPGVMEHYHAMHYKPQLIKPDETQSTRTYEAQYVDKASKSLPFETFRAFFLPPGSDAGPEQESMLNTLGAGLDSNTPTKGNTIGSGIINKTIFLHFKKTMEMLNADLDEGKIEGVESPGDDFEKRTLAHIGHLREYGMKGMLANEEEHTQETGMPWGTLLPMITEAKDRIVGMMHTLTQTGMLPEFEINPEEEHSEEKRRLLGVLLGLMMKLEKRLLMNHAILGVGSEETGVDLMTNLKNLSLVELNINQALAKRK